MIVKPLVLGLLLICAALSPPAPALTQDLGDASCDVISAFVAASPAYTEVFRSYVEGFLAAETNAGLALLAYHPAAAGLNWQSAAFAAGFVILGVPLSRHFGRVRARR